MTAPDRTTLDRFWSRVEKSNGCWLWAGARSHGRYGKLSVDGRLVDTHRLAWTLATGETLTRSDRICHTCDIEQCVRNDDEGIYVVNGIEYPRRGHLFRATAAVNTADMVGKGRHSAWTRPDAQPRGSNVNRGHLTEADILQIRRIYDAGEMNGPELALMFRTTRTNIYRIALRQTWRHV